jgi:hypothetical protein
MNLPTRPIVDVNKVIFYSRTLARTLLPVKSMLVARSPDSGPEPLHVVYLPLF